MAGDLDAPRSLLGMLWRVMNPLLFCVATRIFVLGGKRGNRGSLGRNLHNALWGHGAQIKRTQEGTTNLSRKSYSGSKAFVTLHFFLPQKKKEDGFQCKKNKAIQTFCTSIQYSGRPPCVFVGLPPI